MRTERRQSLVMCVYKSCATMMVAAAALSFLLHPAVPLAHAQITPARGDCLSIQTFEVTPTTVLKSSDKIDVKLVVKNDCSEDRQYFYTILYGNDLVLTSNAPAGGVAWQGGERVDKGRISTQLLPWDLSSVRGLQKNTSFYAVVRSGPAGRLLTDAEISAPVKSNPVAVTMPFVKDDSGANVTCGELRLSVFPANLKFNTDVIESKVTIVNNCSASLRLSRLAVYYNNDISAHPDDPFNSLNATGPGDTDNESKITNVSKLRELHKTNNFYAVGEYTDPTTGKNVRVVSNVVVVTAEDSVKDQTGVDVKAGDGGKGDGSKIIDAPVITGGVLDKVDQAARCANAKSTVNCVINLFLDAIVGSAVQFLKSVTVKISELIEKVLTVQVHDDKFAAVIYPAWLVLRNLANIIFILAIVAMGVATVFRISGWAVKDIMVKLIVGAVLINFSLTITQAILGIGDVLLREFIDPKSGALAAIYNSLFRPTLADSLVSGSGGEFSDTVRTLASFFLAFAAFIAFLGLLGILVLRIIAIWLLLLASPLPFVAMVLPITRKMGHDWWSKLFKWTFMAPVLGFLLTLTATITETYNKSDILKSIASGAPERSGEQSVFQIASYVIPLAMMFASLKAASSFMKGAGGLVDKVADKGMSAAFLPAAALGGYAVGAAKQAGKTAATVAKSPITLAGKGVASLKDRGVDRLKIWQAKGAQAILPDATAKGFGAGARRLLGNIVSGGELTEAAKQARKAVVEEEQKDMKRDFRRQANRDKPDLLRRMEAEERSEAESKAAKQLEGLSTKQNLDRVRDLMEKKVLDFGEQARLIATVQKMYEDGMMQDLLELKDASGGSLFNGEITNLYKSIQAKTKDTTTGDSVAVARLSKSINAKAIKENKINYTVDAAKDPGEISDSVAFRQKRLKMKTDEDLAKMHESTFTTKDSSGSLRIRPEHREGLARLALAMRSPAQAAQLASQMTGAQKKAYREVLDDPGLRTRLLASMKSVNNGNRSVNVIHVDPVSGTSSSHSIDINDIATQFRAAL